MYLILKIYYYGNTINKITENDVTTTYLTGRNLKLPNEFVNQNIQIPENAYITSYTSSVNEDNETTNSSITVHCQKNANEIFDYYYEKYLNNNALFSKEDSPKKIITGDATTLIKILVLDNEYTISIEKR